MTHYIDADKMKAEIRRYKNKADERLKIKGRTFGEEQKDSALQNLCGNLLYFIDSLQQEQPEADIEKEIATYFHDWIDDVEENVNPNGIEISKGRYAHLSDIEQAARYFYELGLNARKEE